MSIASSFNQMGSFMTLSSKRDALWNIVEPGDPYDIRKSMIAKVPGDKKIFMGDHLELICLFQAAEIQRLCEFLEDFKSKYREIQRRELDRHSYEIQIKQLNHKLAEQANFREENQKLKEFIKNINTNKLEQEDSIRLKFERLLIQFKQTEEQIARLRQTNQSLTSQVATFDAKYEALRRSKQSEIDDLYSKLSQQSSVSYQFELNSLKSQYEAEIQRFSIENQRLRQGQQQNIRQITIWQQKCRALQEQSLRNPQQQDLMKYERSIAEYENRFMIFGQQIDRLNLVVRDITAKFQISQQKNRDCDNKLQSANREIAQIQNQYNQVLNQNQQLQRKIQDLQNQNQRLQQSGSNSAEYQAKLKLANDEINRLNNQLKTEIDSSNRLKTQLSRLQYEGSKITILQKQLYESKQITAENSSLKMHLAQKQSKIAFLSQQIQRLTDELSKTKNIDFNYQNLINQNQRLQRIIQDLERRNQVTVQEYESRITQKVTEFESRIELINRTKGSEFESRASLLQSEVQRLGELIQKRNQQIESLQRQLREIKSTQSQSDFEVNRRIQNYESVIQGLRRQSEQMTRKIRQLEVFQRRSSQYENKHTIISQQIQRLNYELRSKDAEIQNLKIKLRDQEIAIIQRYQSDTSRKFSTYETNINNLSQQNQDLKRKYADLENKTALISQQFERLTVKLRQLQAINSRYEQQIQQFPSKMRQVELNFKNMYETQISQKQSAYQMTIRSLQGQTDEQIRRKLSQLESLNRKINDYERSIDQMSKQIQRLGLSLRQKIQENQQIDNKNRNIIRQLQESARKYSDLQNMVRSKYEVEASTRITTLQQNVTVFTRENQELKRYVQQYETRFKEQNLAIDQLNTNLRNLSQQNEVLRRKIQETQFSYRNKLDVQVTNQYKLYQKTIADLKKDVQHFNRENNELGNTIKVQNQKIAALSQGDQRLRKQAQTQLEESYFKISQMDNFIIQLKNQNENLKRAKDQIQKAFRQYESDSSPKIALLAQQHERILSHLQIKTQQLRKSQQQVNELTIKLQNLERNMNQSQSSIQQYEIQVKTRISQYEQNITILSQQNTELRTKLQVINELNYKIGEYENKIVILNQQLQRINANLKKEVQKSLQMENSLRNAVTENNQLNKALTDLQKSISQKYEVEATRTIRTLQQNLELSLKQKEQMKIVIARYEQEINNRGLQIQKLTTNIHALTEQNTKLKNQLRELRQNQILLSQRYETQVTSKYSAFEKEIINYQKQNEDLMKKLIQYSERVVPQYENQTVLLRQEIQRLNQRFNQDNNQLASNLKALSQENQNLKKQITELQIYIQKEQAQTTQKITSYEQNFVHFQKQNEQLKRYIKQFGGQYEGLGQSHQNLERQIQEYHLRVETQIKKSQLLERNVTELGRENNQLKRRLAEMQIQLQKVIGKLNELSQQNDRIKRQARQNETMIAQRLQIEATQQINLHKQQLTQMESNLKASQRQIQTLQKRLSDLGSDANQRISSYEQELKRLANEIQNRNLTIKEYDSKIRLLINENQQLKKHIRDTEVSFNQTFQTQIRNRTVTYEQKIQTITKNAQLREKELLQNTNKRIMEMQNKIVLLSQQLERLNLVLKSKDQEKRGMQQQIQRLTNSLRIQIQQNKELENRLQNIKSQTQNEFAELQTSYQLIVKENEHLKKNLMEHQSSIQKIYAELERLQKIINENKKDKQTIAELSQMNFKLSNQIKLRDAEIHRLQTQIEEVRLRLSDQAALEKRIKEHLALMVVLFAEIQTLRLRVKEKQKQVEDVKRQSLAPFKLQSRLMGDKR